MSSIMADSIDSCETMNTSSSGDEDPLSESTLFEFYRHYIDRHSALFKTKYSRNSDGQFACSVCNECCEQEEDMVYHLIVHTGEKPFVCDICLHGFDKQQELNVHAVERHVTLSRRAETIRNVKKTKKLLDRAENKPPIKQEHSEPIAFPLSHCIVPAQTQNQPVNKQRHPLGESCETNPNYPVGKQVKGEEVFEESKIDFLDIGIAESELLLGDASESGGIALPFDITSSDIKQELFDNATVISVNEEGILIGDVIKVNTDGTHLQSVVTPNSEDSNSSSRTSREVVKRMNVIAPQSHLDNFRSPPRRGSESGLHKPALIQAEGSSSNGGRVKHKVDKNYKDSKQQKNRGKRKRVVQSKSGLRESANCVENMITSAEDGSERCSISFDEKDVPIESDTIPEIKQELSDTADNRTVSERESEELDDKRALHSEITNHGGDLQTNITKRNGDQIQPAIKGRSKTKGDKQAWTNSAGLTGTGAKRAKGRTFIKCAYCSYESYDKSCMSRHMGSHTGYKPFKCPFGNCPYVAVTQAHINVHVRKHTGEKPFRCAHTHCDYAARVSSHLKRHELKHTGERPFSCSECGFSSNRIDNLTAHAKRHIVDNT